MIPIFSGKGTAYEMKNISDPGSETPAAVNRVGKRHRYSTCSTLSIIQQGRQDTCILVNYLQYISTG